MAQSVAEFHALISEAIALGKPPSRPRQPKDGISATTQAAVREALKLLSKSKEIPQAEAEYARLTRLEGLTARDLPKCRKLVERRAAVLPVDVVARVLAAVPDLAPAPAPTPKAAPVPTVPKRRGRPPKGERAQTAAERTKAYRERAGLHDLRVSAALADRVRRMRLREGDTVEIFLTRALNTLEREG